MNPEPPPPQPQANTPLFQPDAAPAFQTPQPKKRKKLLWGLLLVVILAAGASAAYFLLNHKASPKSSTAAAPPAHKEILSAALPQYGTDKMAAGYLKFNPAKFKEQPLADTAKFDLDKLNIDSSKVNTVIFPGNILSFDQSGLYAYDLVNNKVYRLTDGGNDPRIMSDHFLVYAWGQQEKTDQSYKIILLNLLTGQSQTLKSGTSRNIAETSCCAVSPDGFRLAIPEDNNIEVWDIRTGTSTNHKVTLQTFAKGFPTDDTFFQGAPYYSEASYPTPAWLDNKRLIYADGSPEIVTDADGNRSPADNNAFILDTTTDKTTQIPVPSGGVDEFDIAAQGTQAFVTANVFYLYKLDLTGQSQPQTLGNTIGFSSVSPDGTKLYIFNGLHSPGAETVTDVATGATAAVNFIPAGLNDSDVTQVIPDGWIDNNDELVKLTETGTGTNSEYEAVFNTSTDTVTEYVKI